MLQRYNYFNSHVIDVTEEWNKIWLKNSMLEDIITKTLSLEEAIRRKQSLICSHREDSQNYCTKQKKPNVKDYLL